MPRTRSTNQQHRFNQDGISIFINMDATLQQIGAGVAMTESMKDPRYIDAIMDEAFERADDNFNTLAASYAATGAISHMFEWGTLGINRGRSNMRPNPNSPVARLWHTSTEGTGLDRTIWFSYRPSIASVPKPTTRDTGMSSEVIRKMKSHVFTWKAQVMELGETVTIKPEDGKFLLIPATEENRPYMRPHDVKRGHMMTNKEITSKPGFKAYAGNFTQLWMGFWGGAGLEYLQESVNEQVRSDYEPEFRKPRTVGTIRPIGTMNVKTEIKKNSKKVQKKVIRKAQLRRVTK